MGMLGTLFDLLLAIAAFTMIIVVHELGHFLAARWAGIRVLAFAVGFGPAACSYRAGLGWRRGSSEGEYQALRRSGAAARISPTEYRLNTLPLGGYVKMLGQDDADPSARSDEPDSYQRCVPWKRMIVISAGVVANVILAALLFMAVFLIGLRTEPAKIGDLAPGSPAASAVATNADRVAPAEPRLQPGDRVVSVGGRAVSSFKDLAVATALSRKGTAIELVVTRDGVPAPLHFAIKPEVSPLTGMLELGIAPPAEARLLAPPDEPSRALMRERLDRVGLAGVSPGMTLVRVNDHPAASPYAIDEAARTSRGEPIHAAFRDGEREVTVAIQPRRELSRAVFELATPRKARFELAHVAGLVPVMSVDGVEETGASKGLLAGDIFAQVGEAEWPAPAVALGEIRRNAGERVRLAVLRRDGDTWRRVDLGQVPVETNGTIGFTLADSRDTLAVVARWPRLRQVGDDSTPSGATLGLPAGASITRVGDEPVRTLVDVLREVRRILDDAPPTAAVDVPLRYLPPAPGAAESAATWTIQPSDALALRTLAWRSPVDPWLFERELTLLRADNPAGAVAMGFHETWSAMLSTYVTFARLFEGSVKVEHLKGPVGIAHIGTLLAGRGLVWLLFFMGVISVNLAVVNFLPLPVMDGGHFLLLLYEQITGRPVSVAFQNAATLAGLLIIGSIFIITTFNDVMNLFGR